MNQYEVAILYHPDLEVDLSKAEEKVLKLLQDDGGKVLKTDNWGKRSLAYSIKGNEQAVYVFYNVELDPKSISSIEKTLNITNEVIRFLITKVDLKAQAKAEAKKAQKAEQLKELESRQEKQDEDLEKE